MLAASLLLCLVGANLSLSRAGVILAWAIAVFVAVYGLVRGWRKLRPVARINLAAVTLAVLFIFYFAVAGFGRKDILQQFRVDKPIHHRLFPVLDNINLTLGGRPELDLAALKIWRDNPTFGVGGWGFRYLLPFYRPEEEWDLLAQNTGKANVHCDPLQFLAEFGLVGSGLMHIALLALIVPLFHRTEQSHDSSDMKNRQRSGVSRRNPIWVMCVVGLSLVVVFSLIDLPFRCPAILCSWVVILAGLGRLNPKPRVSMGLYLAD